MMEFLYYILLNSLGIAFEQGKVLPIPETIPFRLTQNIEIGMGVSGVEGTMRHCCEKTLTVLRDQRQIIITLLQVLLYDPLFKWSITPAKAHDIQSGTSSRLIENNQCKYNFYFHIFFFFSVLYHMPGTEYKQFNIC